MMCHCDRLAVCEKALAEYLETKRLGSTLCPWLTSSTSSPKETNLLRYVCAMD